jgi:hypothetical protein
MLPYGSVCLIGVGDSDHQNLSPAPPDIPSAQEAMLPELESQK